MFFFSLEILLLKENERLDELHKFIFLLPVFKYYNLSANLNSRMRLQVASTQGKYKSRAERILVGHSISASKA